MFEASYKCYNFSIYKSGMNGSTNNEENNHTSREFSRDMVNRMLFKAVKCWKERG